MEKVIDQQLSDELQDLYFQNRQWLSGVLFLEDETRIFRKIYDQFFSTAIKGDRPEQVQDLNTRLIALENHRKELKSLIIKHQSLLESIITHPRQVIGINLIEKHTKIINDIRKLFASDEAVKKELLSL